MCVLDGSHSPETIRNHSPDVGAVIRFELIEGESTGKSDECANSNECLSASFYGSNYGAFVVQVRHQKSSKVQTL